jgi:uncharacterized protein (TIGR02246 family)
MSEKEKILSIEQPFNEAFDRRDPERLADFYTEDGTSQAPFEGPVVGRDALLAMFRTICADPHFTFRFAAKHVEVAASGELAWSVGTFVMTMNRTGGDTVEKMEGAYQTIWKRQAYGDWKVLYDTMTPTAIAAS